MPNCLATDWWNRQKHGYLVNLRESQNLATKRVGQANVAVGDVVTVLEDETARGFWGLERIKGLIVSKGKEIRGATVKVSSPKGRMTLVDRPLSKFFTVEVKDIHIPTLPETSQSQSSIPHHLW